MFRSLVLLVVLLSGCGSQAEPVRRDAPDAAAPAAAEGVVYVDVRTPEEFATGHVAGAINIPHDQMEARWEELAAHRDQPLALYCRSGRRSGLAREVLRARGFSQAENAGAYEELVAQGVPTGP